MSRLRPYQPPSLGTSVDLDLSRNEGRPPPLQFEEEVLAGLANRYPDVEALRRAVARRHGVEEDRVLVTAGGDDALARCFLQLRGERAVVTTPSFEMIYRYAEQTGARLTRVPWWTGPFPRAEFIAAGEAAGMAVVVSPNNPTGSVITATDLEAIAAAFPRVVLDAAYAEFADEDLTSRALELGNVMVIRTLSKAYGLAGLRVGYLLGPAEMVSQVSAYGSPFAVSGISVSLAAQAVEFHDPLPYVARVREERKDLTALLDELRAGPLPSQANFVLATEVDPAWVVGAAAALGVGLRRFPENLELRRSVRITLPGDPDGYLRLEHTLRTVLAPQALLFDLDGVLADVSGSYRAAIVETAATFGVEVSSRDISLAKAAGDANDDWELTRRLCLAAGVEADPGEVKKRFEDLYQGGNGAPGLKEREKLLVSPRQLQRWAARLPLAIVTGRPRADADAFLERFGIGDLFAAVVTREDAPMKPDPAPVRFALKRLGVEQAWMLGDTPDDLTAARDAGVLPLGVATPEMPHGYLDGAAAVLETTNQLEELLDAATR
ncbi:MAG: aminotransferase class I/II-fold pyridoxal phosphate-dependent enzyme [Acidimicrobiia bacterium]